MKNPENKPLKIVFTCHSAEVDVSKDTFAIVLSNLAVAESNLVRAGKDSAMPHFLAIIKELENLCGFSWELINDK